LSTAEIWKSVFAKWPEGIARRGLLVNSLNETIPFKGFMIKENLLLLDRTNPDPAGTRFVLMSFDAVHTLKFIDQLKEAVLKADGFQGKFG
jgi:hypothetical protein